jgi:hypothetical protein
MTVASRRTIYTHKTGAETQIFTILRKDRNRPRALADALATRGARPMRNTRSGRCAVLIPAPGLMLDDGAIESRVRLLRPIDQHALPAHMLEQTAREDTDAATIATAWREEMPPSLNSGRRGTPPRASSSRSGAACPMTIAASTASRPTTASVSSAA